MTGFTDVPSWWLELTGMGLARVHLELLAEVNRQGAGKNDRVAVARIWRELDRARALRELMDAPRDPS